MQITRDSREHLMKKNINAPIVTWTYCVLHAENLRFLPRAEDGRHAHFLSLKMTKRLAAGWPSIKKNPSQALMPDILRRRPSFVGTACKGYHAKILIPITVSQIWYNVKSIQIWPIKGEMENRLVVFVSYIGHIGVFPENQLLFSDSFWVKPWFTRKVDLHATS